MSTAPRVIRTRVREPGSSSDTPSCVPSALGAARGLLRAARDAASGIERKATLAARDLTRAAYEEGFRSGLDSLRTQLLDSQALEARVLRGASALLMELVSEIAEEVVGDLGRKHPELIRARVNLALAGCGRGAVLAVHPADRSALEELLAGLSEQPLIEDAQLGRGAVAVETQTYQLTLDFSEHLSRLKEEVLQETFRSAIENDLHSIVHETEKPV